MKQLLVAIAVLCALSGKVYAADAVWGAHYAAAVQVDTRAQSWQTEQSSATHKTSDIEQQGITGLFNQLKTLLVDTFNGTEAPANNTENGIATQR